MVLNRVQMLLAL